MPRANLILALGLAMFTTVLHAACRAITSVDGPAWAVDVGSSAGYETRGAAACSACGGQWISRPAGGFYCRRNPSSGGAGIAVPGSGDPVRAAGEAGVAAGLAFHEYLEEQAARAKAQKAAREAQQREEERRRREEDARKKEESWQRLSGTMRLESQDTLALRMDPANDLAPRLGDKATEIVEPGEELRDGPEDDKKRKSACPSEVRGPMSSKDGTYFQILNKTTVRQNFTLWIDGTPYATPSPTPPGAFSKEIWVGGLQDHSSYYVVCHPVVASRKP